MSPADCFSAELLADWVADAAARSNTLVADLSDEHLMGPQMEIVNPMLWEIGHVAWFYEKWMLSHLAGREPFRPEVDSLYDSAAIPHDVRWDLPLLSREIVLQYIDDVRCAVIERLASSPLTDQLAYFVLLSVFHEDMHTEAYTYTRQTLCYPAPCFDGMSRNNSREKRVAGVVFDPEAQTRRERSEPPEAAIPEGSQNLDPSHPPGKQVLKLPLEDSSTPFGDVEIPGGTFLLGACETEPFVFDNEQWAHPVEINPFAISRTAVTQEKFVAFVEDEGYRRRNLWCDDGWKWRESINAEHPLYWKRETNGNWQRRVFDQWIPLEPHRPVLHINWYEANAYCRWAKRRLPTEAEWETAAASSRDGLSEKLSTEKRRFPWGSESPNPSRANLDWREMGTVDVTQRADGDSAFGCRQMIGNVWEWTADDFLPYPGFVIGPYKEYSTPWFGDHKILRGGCWTTRSRHVRNTLRNFYKPNRRDIWAGFRTCAVE
jgi:iron(II)-dependent oxidoreductase